MINGNWVPISKALVRKLPTMREYSEVEAMFSIAVDYDCQNSASIAGYASLWGWSRKRVNTFLNKYGLVIEYQTKFDRHKKGKVSLKQLDVPAREQEGNRKGTGRGQVEFIDSRSLRTAGNRRGTGREQEGNRKGSTTKDPNPKPKEKDIVETMPRPHIPFKEIVSHLNKKTNRGFNHSTKSTQAKIRARWNEGHRVEDFKAVIDHKSKEWLTDDQMVPYLRPDTLFGTKFEGYLQAAKQGNQHQRQSRWNKQGQQADHH